MMIQLKPGQIVWHDLFTSNRKRSMVFYQRVANWSFQIEQATDFAWGGGEQDFVLALAGSEAGAGFTETPIGHENGWIPYIEVTDVFRTVERIGKLGGTIVRLPFDVPGVGRNALVRDPLGAIFGISQSQHSFPAPRAQFGPEVYVSNNREFPWAFYSSVCGWQNTPGQDAHSIGLYGETATAWHAVDWSTKTQATWIPCLKVYSVEDAYRSAIINEARLAFGEFGKAMPPQSIALRDPNSTLFAFCAEQTHAD